MKTIGLFARLLVGLLLAGCTKKESAISGTWYMSGVANEPCSIKSTPKGLIVMNEKGMLSQLVYDPSGFVVATDWEGGLRGDVNGKQIMWWNGSMWTRTPSQ